MNTIEQVNQLIDKVCLEYEFDRSYLSKKKEGRPMRTIIKGKGKDKIKVDLSSIRMAISYFLTTYTNFPTAELGPLCGYSDHSTIVYAKKKAVNYINFDDAKFMPVWDKVTQIADSLEFSKDYVRYRSLDSIPMIKVHK